MTGFTIGKVAKAAEVGVETIRFYERKGLIEQPVATSTYRIYPRSVVERIRFIKRAKELGFKLDEIKNLLALADCPKNDRAAVKTSRQKKLKRFAAGLPSFKKRNKRCPSW